MNRVKTQVKETSFEILVDRNEPPKLEIKYEIVYKHTTTSTTDAAGEILCTSVSIYILVYYLLLSRTNLKNNYHQEENKMPLPVYKTEDF